MVHAIVADPSGNFLYVNVGGAPPSFNTYSIDQTTGALTQLSSSTQIAFPFGQWTVADPQGSYLYTLLNGSVHGFQADPTAGTITNFRAHPSPTVHRTTMRPDYTSPTPILRLPLAPIWRYRVGDPFRKRLSEQPRLRPSR